MKIAQLILTLAIVTVLSGCGFLEMTGHDLSLWTSRHWSAEKAWHARRWMYADMPCRGSFKAGFKAGYRFASGGYDSCEPPQVRHYWRIGRLTESERQNAQAWSEGFTHGTVAAQQDHAAGPSAFDMAAMQPPEGVPDVRYSMPPQMPTVMGQDGPSPYPPNAQAAPSFTGSPSFQGQMAPDYQFPPAMGENFQYAPNGGNMQYAPNAENFQYTPPGDNFQYSPPPVPMPVPASEAGPAPSGPLAPRFAPLPPPAPGGMPGADMRYLPSATMASEGSPGIGSLRQVSTLPPAPPAEPAGDWLPQQQAASPRPQATQAAEWELPLIRN